MYLTKRGSHEQYLSELKQSMFILSPPGNGIDCHRTWEAILSVPIVLSSFSFGALAESSPVWEVDDFPQLNSAQLHSYRHTRFDAPGVFANYWFILFKQASQQAKFNSNIAVVIMCHHKPQYQKGYSAATFGAHIRKAFVFHQA